LTGYLLRRACSYTAVLAVALSLNFILPRLIPGNPIEELTGGVGSVAVALDPQTRAALRSYYGLDEPLFAQFKHYLQGLLQGDLGYSIHYRTAVGPLLLERLPWTFFITISSILLSFSAAICLGPRSLSRGQGEGAVVVPAVLLESMPSFVLGSILLVLLSVKLPLFPLSGAYTPFSGLAGWRKVLDLIDHAALPVLVLSASSFFSAYLVVRSSTRLVKNEAYVLMAEMKGLSERTIRYRYVLRTALLPVVTFFGLRLAYSAGGAIMVEVLFAYPGIGKLTYEAVLAHDYALLQGAFTTFTLWVLLMNLLTDCLYVSLDSRVKEV
jgi:peptide/nickel transport system permease protein